MTHFASNVDVALPQIQPFQWRHLVPVILVLNLVDSCFTLAWISSGMATEANEVMATVLELGPVAFAMVKMCLVTGGVYVLVVRSQTRLAQVGLSLTTVVYTLVCTHHLHFLAVMER
jgi:hypothetical protein